MGNHRHILGFLYEADASMAKPVLRAAITSL